MTTEGERLKAWMIARKYSAAALARRLDYGGNALSDVMNGVRRASFGLKFKFERVFGDEITAQIFDPEPPRKPRQPPIGQREAHKALTNAIKDGVLPPATTFRCHGCNKQGKDFHHASYHPGNRLCVVPLCRSCHRQHHYGSKPMTFGVIALPIGIVRIAIAGLITP